MTSVQTRFVGASWQAPLSLLQFLNGQLTVLRWKVMVTTTPPL